LEGSHANIPDCRHNRFAGEAPTLAASQSAKMTGQDQAANGPALQSAKSAKMHGAADIAVNTERQSVLRGRAEP
jgi:hypothetical protein